MESALSLVHISLVQKPGVVDFAVKLLNSVLTSILCDRQVMFWGEFKLQKNCNQSCSSKFFFQLVEMYSSV